MGTEATVETFPDLVADGPVLVDFWGPNCAPCLALMPAIEEMEKRLGGKISLVKVNAPENRQICRDLKVFGLPTYVLYRDGAEFNRLSGDPTIEEIETALNKMIGGD